MDKRDLVTLRKIIEHIERTVSYTAQYSDLKDFEMDSMCVEAVVFNLMQIGELSKSALSDELKLQVKNIPWNQIYGLRNRIVHGYEGVDLSIVWDTIKEDLPKLYEEINNVLSE